MDAQKRIDKILKAVHEQVEEEIKVLLGVEFSLSDHHNRLAGKEQFFDSLAGKQVLAKIDLVGDVEGSGCLVLGIKDAIRLGGTLIMLPDAELEEVVGREEYGGETEDSYGEIANIIAGAYTKTFEEMYSKAFRFVRKEQQVIVPLKVEADGDEPVPNQQYYQVSSLLKLEGRQLGELHMLMPAKPLGLLTENEVVEEAAEPVKSEEDVAETPSMEPEAAAEETAAEATAPLPPSPDSSPRKPVDPVKHKKRIDKLLQECEKRLGEDLSGLVGTTLSFSDMENRLVSKEELFLDELQRKQIIADMDIVGELAGRGYFLCDLKDAIQLGGILIMLPPTELEAVMLEEEFSDDTKDAYGEVANIVSGVYTQVFEEQYTEKIRFVKKGVQSIVPLKVDIASAEPMPDQQYYMSAMTLRVEGVNCGRVRMILPAELFHLLPEKAAVADKQPESVQPAPAESARSEPVQEKESQAAAPAAAPSAPRLGPAEQEKHRKRVDKLLKECRKQMQEEVSALLGASVSFTDLENRLVSKEEFFFDIASGKQVLTNLDVVGDLEDRSYLAVSLKDAIHLGGVLIMLPPSELESVVVDEEFGDDTRDAFGEIANIVSGVYTAIFEEQYVDKIRFVKKDLGVVVPMKVDIDSDEPLPDVEYYLSTMTLGIDDEKKGQVHLLFPAQMLKLDSSGAVAVEEEPEVQEVPGVGRVAQEEHRAIDILLISDDESAAARIRSVAEAKGLACRQISFKENVKAAITQELKAVYLVMRDVNEQAFGMAIKVSSSSSLPLIAAGPDWTRTKVIKAVKYGVNDILLTPADDGDISENLENNLVQMAA